MDDHVQDKGSARPSEPICRVPGLPPLTAAALFLDFDGTLVEIAPTPDGIHVDPGLPDLLAELNRRIEGRMALISGRSIAALDGFLPGYSGVVVGSHGAERRGGPGKFGLRDLPKGFDDIRARVRDLGQRLDGVIVEEKPFSTALHFRQAPEAMARAEAALGGLVAPCEGIVLHHAKMALEVMPEHATKGAAMEDLMAGWAGAVPVAFGDDLTDEAMLRRAGEMGGISVKVGEGPSCAAYRVKGPAQVHEMLQGWIARPAGTP